MDLEKLSLQRISALCLVSMEYLAFRQGRPVFLSSELRILIGHGALDYFSELNLEIPSSGLENGQVDQLFFLLSQVQNGPQLTSFGMSLPVWSHFSQGYFY